MTDSMPGESRKRSRPAARPRLLLDAVAALTILVLTPCLAGCRSIPDDAFRSPTAAHADLPGARVVFDAAARNESVRIHESGPATSLGEDPAAKARVQTRQEDAERVLAPWFARVFSGTSVEETVTVRFRSENVSSSGWMLGSLATLGVLNLFGMPFHEATERFHLVVVIGSDDRVRRPRVRTQGEGSAFAAPWWGHSVEDAQRLANLRAIRRAIEELDAELGTMADPIRARLSR